MKRIVVGDGITLTPLQDQVMATVAARYRLGETEWVLSRLPAILRAVEYLEGVGLLIHHSPRVEDTVRVELTDLGRSLWINPDYRPPTKIYRIAGDAALDDALGAADGLESFGLPVEYIPRVKRWLESRKLGD